MLTLINKSIALKKVYTIHDKQANPFTLQLNNPNTNKDKSTVLAFNKFDDTVYSSKMLELNKRMFKEYPKINTNDNSLWVYNDENKHLDLTDLSIKEWELDSLRIYSINNFFDILYIDEIINEKTKYNFKGNLYRLDLTDIKFYINILNQKYKL